MTVDPDALAHDLIALAKNAAWSFRPEIQELFAAIDAPKLEAARHSPLALVQELDRARLVELAADPSFRVRTHAARAHLDAYLASESAWADREASGLGPRPVAYFCAEFGIHESIPLYSGGLGVLAGDHIKSASDLGIPLVGVGLFYQHGYFTQRFDKDGRQVELYPETDPARVPMEPVPGVEVKVETRTGVIAARLWTMRVGRSLLVLLDSDVPSNTEADRDLTGHLYGGDARTRIRQEVLLGVGGIRALRALGIRPSVFHLNEGHSAFAGLELIRERVLEEGVSVGDAFERLASSIVFTTHTPVPAGHDRFDPALTLEHLGPIAKDMGLKDSELLAFGRVDPENDDETFCMTVLALKVARHANGVSQLHGAVSRHMWRSLWPARDERDIPIGHITNGVHLPTWMARPMRELFDRYGATDWIERQAAPETWRVVDGMEDVHVWAAHAELKSDLVRWVRQRVRAEAERRGESAEIVDAMGQVLSADSLLVGFARRFATYKRATLLFGDLDALDRVVNDPARPVTFLFAGKSHPRDEGGKQLLQDVFRVTRDPRFRGKVVLLENYDIEVGRRLVSGVDVWLNNPRRPLEASGTSGEKAILNGVLNCSILDGWWAEAWDGKNGFAIGDGRIHADVPTQDSNDAAAAMKVLVEEVVPLYYDRDPHGLPRRWVARVKRAFETLAWRFTADRMLIDYVRHCYLPAAGLVQSGMRR